MNHHEVPEQAPSLICRVDAAEAIAEHGSQARDRADYANQVSAPGHACKSAGREQVNPPEGQEQPREPNADRISLQDQPGVHRVEGKGFRHAASLRPSTGRRITPAGEPPHDLLIDGNPAAGAQWVRTPALR